MGILKSNHVSLIDACYPPSAALITAAPDYAPNSQETSRLVYYASNRTGKIQKLGAELERKATHEAARAAAANMRYRASLLITLALFKALATECRHELALFTPYLIRTVSLVFSQLAGDLEVMARAASVFTTWCSYTDASLIGIDDSVTKAYFTCLSFCCDFCMDSQTKDLEVRYRRRLVGLAAVNAVVESEAMYRPTTEFQAQANQILPALIRNMKYTTIEVLERESRLIRDKPGPSSPYLSEFRPAPLAERRAPSIHKHIDGVDGPSEGDVINACLRILSTLLQRCRATYMSQCLNTAFNVFEQEAMWGKPDLCIWYIRKTTEWTQYQYRYTVLSRLVERLVSIPDGSGHTPHRTLLSALHAVLTSQISLVNISTSDIMSQLMAFLLRRTALDPNDPILPSVTECISAMSTHIYYADQVQDLVQELISKLASVQIHGPLGTHRRANEESRIKALLLLLDALSGLMAVAERHAPHSETEDIIVPDSRTDRQEGSSGTPGPLSAFKTLHRSRIDPEIWQDGLALLCENDYLVRSAYAEVLVRYMVSELTKEERGYGASGKIVPSPRSPLHLGDSVTRFLHALHASIFSLATTSSLGLSTPEPSRPDSIRTDPSVTANAATDEPAELDDIPTIETEDVDIQDRRKSRRLSINLSLLDSSTVRIPLDTSNEAATLADYRLLRRILTTLHELFPLRGVFTGVPMLLALNSTLPHGSAATIKRTRAIHELLLHVWKAIGQSWKCQIVLDIVEKELSKCVPHIILDDLQSSTPEFSQVEGMNVSPLDSTSLVTALASCEHLQRFSGYSEPTISKLLQRPWSVEGALKDSVERFSGHDAQLSAGPSPLIKLSPQLMHIENLSLSSLARGTRGVGVTDLREALDGRSPMTPSPRLPNASASTLDHYSQVHHQLGLQRTRSRPKVGKGEMRRRENPGDIRELLTKIGLGKEGGSNLLKASFPKPDTKKFQPAVSPPYPM